MIRRAMLLSVCLCMLAGMAGGRTGMAEESYKQWPLRRKITQKLMLNVRRWSPVDAATPEEIQKFPAFTQMIEPVEAWLKRVQPGGIVLFGPNTPDTATTLQLVDAMQQAVTGTGVPPLLVAIDQEGGRVNRLGEGTSLPGNMALGAAGDPEGARQAGHIIGTELRALGINMDFAPDLDVNSNPLNPVINIRSFGEDPQTVASLGLAFARGMQGAGVIPVVKHFPGHGDTQTDSHVALPRVDKSLAAIQATELAPFQQAIDAGLPAVMTAHIQYPALDSTAVRSMATDDEVMLPATLSPAILTGVLRGQMGFEGVIFTDAMNMDAIAKHFGVGEALVRAFEAGVDIALMPIEIYSPGDMQKLEDAITEVEEAVADGRLTESAIDASVERILALKATLPPMNARPLEQRLADAHAIVGSAEHKAQERALAASTVTVLRNDGVIPMQPREGQQVLLVAAYDTEVTALRFGIERLISEGKLPRLNIASYAYNGQSAVEDTLAALIESADFAVVTSRVGSAEQLKPGQWQADLPKAVSDMLAARGIPCSAVSTLLPQDASLLTKSPALLVVYNPTGMSEAAYANQQMAFGPSLPAAMDVLFGAAEARGKLPVAIYGLDGSHAPNLATVLYPRGFGLE